jgi:hypothetical protein
VNGVHVRAAGGVPIEPGVPFTPEVYFGDTYHPICALGFADNNHGATKFCLAAGFPHGGVSRKTSGVYAEDAMPVGTCKSPNMESLDIKAGSIPDRPMNTLDTCNGGRNSFGDLAGQGGDCTAGNNVGLEIVCNAQVRNLDSSLFPQFFSCERVNLKLHTSIFDSHHFYLSLLLTALPIFM